MLQDHVSESSWMRDCKCETTTEVFNQDVQASKVFPKKGSFSKWIDLLFQILFHCHIESPKVWWNKFTSYWGNLWRFSSAFRLRMCHLTDLIMTGVGWALDSRRMLLSYFACLAHIYLISLFSIRTDAHLSCFVDRWLRVEHNEVIDADLSANQNGSRVTGL